MAVMTPFTDLEREMFASAARLTMPAVRRLIGMGVDQRFVARLTGAGMIGVGNVMITSQGWEPGGPDPRLLLGVVHQEELVDIVAISSGRRDEWALRTKMGWALGAFSIEKVHRMIESDLSGEPTRHRVRLHATPFDWMASGGDGVCILDWSAATLMELRALGERVTLEVPPGGGEKIRNLLAYGALPRVAETRLEYAGVRAA